MFAYVLRTKYQKLISNPSDQRSKGSLLKSMFQF